MLKKAFYFAIFFSILISSSFSQEISSAEAIIDKLKANQSLVQDLQADTKTVITSNITMPGQQSKGPQTMTQTGHIWQKGKDKSKVEVTSPMKQITITNGNIMTIISPDTGRKFTQDLSKGPGAGGQGLDTTKTLDSFDLKVTTHKEQISSAEAAEKVTEYIISGTPKEANKFLGRMDFIIDAERYVPVRIALYDPKGALMSLSELEYEPVEISSAETAYVPKKMKSIITMQMGSVNTEMTYENIKVNQGIKDEVFEAQ